MTGRFNEVARLREQSVFLGYEFLTWLLLLLDRDDAKHNAQKIIESAVFKEKVAITLGTRVATCLFNHKEQKTTITSPILEDSHEIFASLKNGHVVFSLSLNCLFGERLVNVTLHASDFAFTAIKVKDNFDGIRFSDEKENLSEEEKIREEMFLRMAAVEDLERVIDAFYQRFLELRNNAAMFASEIATMRRQIGDRLERCLGARKELSSARAA